MRAQLSIAVAAAALLVMGSGAARATRFLACTISYPRDGVSEFRPRIAGDVVVWQRGAGAGAEVMRWDGAQAVNMTQNGVADLNPETDGIHVVWQQGNGSQRDIAIYDVLTGLTTLLTSPSDEVLPLVSGTYLAWVRNVDADGEVFIDPGPPGNQLTGNSLVEREFALDGKNLVWSQGDELSQTPSTADDQHDIAVWNGELEGFYILGGSPSDDIHPSLAGDVVVWQAGPDGSGDIWYGDTQGTANLLYDGSDERNPHTDASRVVWEHWDGADFELYRVDLASPNVATPVTNDAYDDVTPRIQGDNLVWVKKVVPGDSEIWVSWHGAPPEPLPKTSNNGRDDVEPRLDGDFFVYESCTDLGQPSELCDIVLVPEPRATLLAGMTIFVLAGMAARSARRALEDAARHRAELAGRRDFMAS